MNKIPENIGAFVNPNKMSPFIITMKQNFPFIEDTMQAGDYYGLLCQVVNYLNQVIQNLNTNEENIDFLNTNFKILQEFVDNYFTNLDVQQEINNKLDEMAESGVLTTLLQKYVVDAINPQITALDNKINSVASGSPAGTYASLSDLENANPDHSKIYVVLSDKNWYYFSPTYNTWKAGGLYLSSGVSDGVIAKQNLSTDLQTYFGNSLESGGYSGGYSGEKDLIKIASTIHARTIKPFRSINSEYITLNSDLYEFFTIYYNLDGSYFSGYGNYVTAIVRNTTPVDIYFVFRRKDKSILTEEDYNNIENTFLIDGKKYINAFNENRINLNSININLIEENLLENIISNISKPLKFKPSFAHLEWDNDEQNLSTVFQYDNIITYPALLSGNIQFTLKKGFQAKMIYLDENSEYVSHSTWTQAVDSDIVLNYNISQKAYLTIASNTITSLGTYTIEERYSDFKYLPKESITTDIKRNNFAHLSIDDVTYCFINLKNNYETYSSLFDEPLFNYLKDLHEKYGVVFTLFAYNLNVLNDIGDKFKPDFIKNSDWLKIGFHSQDSGSMQQNTTLEVLEFYNNFITNIERIAGNNTIDKIIRLNYFYATKEQLTALKNAKGGIYGLLTSDNGITVPYLSTEQNEFLQKNSNLIDTTLKLYYFATNFRIDWFLSNGPLADTTPTEELEKRYSDAQYSSYYNDLVAFTHEWLLYTDNYNFIEPAKTYFEDVCKFIVNYNFTPNFPQNKIIPLNF